MLFQFDQVQASATTATTETDEALMARIKQHDESALNELYRRHLALLRTVVLRVTNNDDDAEEVLQEAFLEVWRRVEHYTEEKGKALGWIVTLARRRAIDRVRRRQAYQAAQQRNIASCDVGGEFAMEHAADEEVISADRTAILQNVLNSLPDAQKSAITMAFYQGMSQREIAAQTGIPLGTIKTRLELAIKKVRSGILALGGESEWHSPLGNRQPEKKSARSSNRRRSGSNTESEQDLATAPAVLEAV